MSLLFSSNESEVLSRKVESEALSCSPLTEDLLIEVYELIQCTAWIKDNLFKRVALQFPDQLLVDSVEVALRLEETSGAEVFILGDVTYGSCCVDCISAAHADADCLIHFGPACLSALAPGSVPVRYVFVQERVDYQHAAALVRDCPTLTTTKCILILYEVTYCKAAYSLGQTLRETHPCVAVSHLRIPGESVPECNTSNPITICQRLVHLPLNIELTDCSVLYIGRENLTQSHLFMNFCRCPFYTYNPTTKTLAKDTTDVNRTLRRRFYIVERLKDADIIGILIGGLGQDKFLPLVDHLKALIKKRGKRSYILAVGKPNVPKLANFPEIQVFVLVACGQNTLLDSKEFLAPIATPFELELALNPSRSFGDGNYVTDFAQLLPGGQSHVPAGDVPQNDDGDISLVTGKLRKVKMTDSGDMGTQSSMVIRNGMALATLHARAAGEHLSQRSWQGLEQELGLTSVTLAKEGQSGIASGYIGEGQ